MASVILTNWTVYYSSDTGVGGGYKQIRWTGAGAPEVATNTVNEIYSALSDLFSISAQNEANDTTPMVAVTPTVYQIGAFDTGDREPWFIDPLSVQHLTGGSLQTVLWTRDVSARTGSLGIVKITCTGSTIVPGDVGAAISNGTKNGTLLYANATGTELWIRPTASTADDDWTTGSGTVTCNTHTATQATTSVTGERLWSNIYTIGSIYSGSSVYVVQNFTKLPSFWGTGHIDRLILINDGFSGGLIDRGLLTIFAREYGYLYDHFDTDVSAGGRNPVPLATSSDVNNITASGTIGALTGITFTFGESTHDLLNGNGSKKYDVDINCGGNTLANFYEYTKYVTRRTSVTALNGHDGEQYIVPGITRISFDTQTANFAKTYTLTGASSGATGVIEANHDGGTTGTLIVRDVRGTFVNGETITDNQSTPGSAKILASNGIETTLVSKTAPFGTFAGGRFFGARGVYISNVTGADSNKYSLVDSTNGPQSPPVTVPITVNGIVSGDKVSVFRALDVNGTIDRTYIASHVLSNATGSTTWTAVSIPTDTPNSGTIRIRKTATQLEERIAFTERTSTAFTLSSAHSGGYGTGDTAYVPYFDGDADGTTISTSVIYDVDRFITTRVRKKGIQPFTVNSIPLNSSGYTATATRIDDTIAT